MEFRTEGGVNQQVIFRSGGSVQIIKWSPEQEAELRSLMLNSDQEVEFRSWQWISEQKIRSGGRIQIRRQRSDQKMLFRSASEV
jgi:hypothetical protein